MRKLKRSILKYRMMKVGIQKVNTKLRHYWHNVYSRRRVMA